MQKLVVLTVLVSAALSAVAGRTVTKLSGYGWTADGQEVEVPHCWNARDAADGPSTTFSPHGGDTYLRTTVTYRRTLPAVQKGKRVFLKFEAASQKAEVRVNRKLLGTHTGAFTAFAFEATGALKGRDNVLDIAVDNRCDPDLPPADRCDYSIFGGLYRDVWMIETDAACIDPTYLGGPGVAVKTKADGSVDVEVKTLGASEKAKISCKVVETGKTYDGTSFKLPADQVKLWTPKTPVVYHLEVTLTDGKSSDSVTVPFGFRTVEMRADGFYLNGVKHKIRGVCRHQDRQDRGWALWKEDTPEDFAIMKRMGVDGVRTAHYPQSQQTYDICDEQGFIAWCELPLIGGVTPSAAYAFHAAEMQKEMVAQLGNHPSICFWSIANEIYQNGTSLKGVAVPLLKEANERFHRLDPSRPTTEASDHRELHEENAVPDTLAINIYPGWYGGTTEDFGPTIDAFLKENNRTTIGISEYGAGAGQVHHGHPEVQPKCTGREHTEEYQAYLHMEAYRQILARDTVWGSFLWNMFDFASDWRTEGDRDGINDKGLVTYDRKLLKDAYYFYKANWNPEPMLHLVGQRMREIPAGPMTIIGFCNAGEVTLTVNGKDVGTKRPDEVKSVIWRNVRLQEGLNRIELRAGKLVSAAMWTALPGPRPKDDVGPHPRLLATAADFAALKDRCEKNALSKAGKERLVFEADQMLGFPLPSRDQEGRRLLAISQRVLHRVLTLSLAARLTGEKKYARRAIDEMTCVAAYPDWNPSHFLDVAELTLGVSIGYDWLYDEMTDAERQAVSRAIHYKGLCTYDGRLQSGWWVKTKNNWGQVCHAGLLAGACAIADEAPEVARQIVARAVEALPGPMGAFGPEGGFPEGPGFYWGYSMIYNALAIDILKGLCGSDYGLSEQPGFRESVDYMELMTGPTGLRFNYADAGIDPDQIKLIRRSADPAIWWLAKHFGRPDILTNHEAELYAQLAADRTPLEPEPRRSFTRLNPLILLWQVDPAKDGAKVPLCRELKGKVPVVVQRTGWDRNAWFVGLKAGSPNGPHGHMDGGSFVLDAKGVRWAWDLGSEDYNKIEQALGDIWGGKIDAPRWKVFRLNVWSHNTLVLNGGLQQPEGDAVVKSFKAAMPSEAVLDLTSLYPAAQEVTRTGTLRADGYDLVDRIVAKRNTKVRWQMLTPAKVAKAEANVLTLEKDGQTLAVTAPAGAKWLVKDVSAAPSACESPNPGMTQIAFELAVPSSGRLELPVTFR